MEVSYHTTHALQFMKDTILPNIVKGDVDDGYALSTLINVWDDGVKFVCPHNGIFFEDKHYVRYTPYFRLPFKATVLEYDATFGHYGAPGDFSTDFQRDLGVTMLAFEQERGGVLGAHIWVAYSDPQTNRWMVMPGYLFVPYGEGQPVITEANCTVFMPNTAFKYWMKRKGFSDNVAGLNGVAQVLMKESLSLFQFSVAMSCSNVVTEVKKAPKFTNQRRKAKGKLPLYEYHLLTVDVGERNEKGEHQGGTHASPRQHLRRGHVRRYQSGLTIWINEMVVSRTGPGLIEKDYRLRVKKG